MLPIDPELQKRLTDYLDDRLDASSRAEIDRMLDAETEDGERVRQEFTDVSMVRDALKQLDAGSSPRMLDAGFADRVLKASMSRAVAEGLSPQHPLVRLASQDETRTSDSGPIADDRFTATGATKWNRLAVGFAGAVAASIAIALVMLQQAPSPELAAKADIAADALPKQSTTKQAAPKQPRTNSVTESKVATDPAPTLDRLAAADITVDASENTMSRSSDGDRGAAPVNNRSVAMQQRTGSVSSSITGSTADSAMVNVGGSAATKLAAIIVLEVRQTDSGRVSGAVRRAMRQAGIGREDQQPLTEALAESASQTVGLGEDELASMIYLNAPAKRIDQFYENLFSDRRGVQSVALAIATEAPILEVVQSAIPDPTVVSTQRGSAIELLGQAGSLSGLSFTEVSQDSLRGMTMVGGGPGGVNGNSGPDFAAQLLIVIR